MKNHLLVLVLVATPAVALLAQERKPVPKDSVRVMVPGCSKGYAFTAGPAAEDQPGGTVVPEGTHLRMNGPKQTMADIKGNEGSRIEITGLIKKGQVGPEGIRIGRGIRVTPGGGPQAGFGGSIGIGSPGAGQLMIDVEGWRRLPGECPR
ncbi:MAG TPA: hypothetical protein VM032_13495 [Vicinamibacterales bacterium]|nr:hypothetical protein [Vicinamibacterales bacterium]